MIAVWGEWGGQRRVGWSLVFTATDLASVQGWARAGCAIEATPALGLSGDRNMTQRFVHTLKASARRTDPSTTEALEALVE